MNLKVTAPLCLMAALALANLSAQTPSATATPPPLPPGPLVARKAANFAHWTVTTTIKTTGKETTGAPSAEKPSSIQVVTDVTKTGDTRHISVTSTNGDKSDVWCKGSAQVTMRPDWKQPLLSNGENPYDVARINFTKSDFEGFDWVSLNNYNGRAKLADKDCIVYKDDIAAFEEDPHEKQPLSGGSSPGATSPKVAASAYVDLETRLPVALIVGGATTVYKFEDAPTEVVKLPPQAQASIDAWNQKKQNMLRKPAQP